MSLIALKELNKEDLSESIISDHQFENGELLNTFKFRVKNVADWKNMVKLNSLCYFLISTVIVLLSYSQKHCDYFVFAICGAGALIGMTTGFSFGTPSSARIYCNLIIVGLSSLVA